jgi:glycerol-3-phosphate dehydrogenase (NAD(P)+)
VRCQFSSANIGNVQHSSSTSKSSTFQEDHPDTSSVRFRNICVIGGGAWGTALALSADRAGCRTTLWIREPNAVREVQQTRINPFLRAIALPESVHVTSSLREALRGTDCVMLAVPSQFLRITARSCEEFLSPEVPVVICSKGIEVDSGKLMTAVVADEMPGRPHAVLSGPSFAKEVALGQPTAVTVAVECDSAHELLSHRNLATRVAISLSTKSFRPYVSDDPIGVEVGGAVKNVIAIACGMAAGRGLGANPRAALITRGLAEINRLALALGGRSETTSGLAGVGDLTLTCSDEQSRNFAFGRKLAAGEEACSRDQENVPVVEGAWNAKSVVHLAQRLGVEMPICEMVDAVLHRGVSIDRAMEDLLTRPIRAEVRSVEALVRMPNPTTGTRPQGRETVQESASQ